MSSLDQIYQFSVEIPEFGYIFIYNSLLIIWPLYGHKDVAMCMSGIV